MNWHLLVQNTMHLDMCKSLFPVQMLNVSCHTEFYNSAADLMLHDSPFSSLQNTGAMCLLLYLFVFPNRADNISSILHATH